MPRRSRGSSATGGAKAQRTDMVQPPKAPTGMAYGAHNDSIEAQRAVPLPQAPSVAAATPSNPAAPGGGDRLARALAAAQAMPAPTADLAMESARPGEPVTAGLSSGPGPGPEVLITSRPGIADVFERMAFATGDPDMALLAQVARGYEI